MIDGVIYTVCKGLVSPRIFEKYCFFPFFPLKTLNIGSLLLSTIFGTLFCAKFQKYGISYRYHCKHTLRYHFKHGVQNVYIQRDSIVSGIELSSLLLSENLPPFRFPLHDFFRFRVPPLFKGGGTHCIPFTFVPSVNILLSLNRVTKF